MAHEKPIQVYFRTVARTETNMVGRPSWFSYEACWNNLLQTITPELVDLNVVIDSEIDPVDFVPSGDFRVETINSKERLEKLLIEYATNDVTYTDRTESGEEIVKREEPPDREKAAGQLLYEIIDSDNLEVNKVVYIVEDDYLHLPKWSEIIHNFYTIHNGLNYISLYDHADKYSQRYQGLVSQIVTSRYCHWRTVPSTCGTWAAPALALKEDYEIHHDRLGDHNKWMKLAERNRGVLSCMPGRATHCMEAYLSPCIDWESLFR